MSKDVELKSFRSSRQLLISATAIRFAEYVMAARERLARAETVSATKSKRRTQVTRIRELLPIAFPPDGHPPGRLSLKAIKGLLDPVFEKNKLPLPSPDSIARALDRRSR
jgi:hypothetical protein